jgi:hypothetical protein
MAHEDKSRNAQPQAWPFFSWPGAEMPHTLNPSINTAPQSLTQPILPWVFANSISVNAANSSCPEMELEIVAKESYGRQLGRVISALEALIQERPESAPKNEAMVQLLALSQKIEAIKTQSSAARVTRLESDLAWLEKNKPDEYQRIASRFSSRGKAKR